MELDFKGHIETTDVIENCDNTLNVVLWLWDEQYEEMVSRSNFIKETNMTFWDVANSADYFTSYADCTANGEVIRIYFEYDYKIYDVTLTETELKNFKESYINAFKEEL